MFTNRITDCLMTATYGCNDLLYKHSLSNRRRVSIVLTYPFETANLIVTAYLIITVYRNHLSYHDFLSYRDRLSS